jgi:membrane fusion protein (multidrug efflux system)
VTAQANVAQRQADLDSARAQVTSAEAAVRRAAADTEAAKQAVNAQQARLSQSHSDLTAAQAGLTSAQAARQQAQARLSGASTVTEQVSAAEAGKAAALAKEEQAKAALEAAKIALSRTKLFAPVAGVISRRNVQLGQQVSPGQPLLAIIPDAVPWVVANLKETQLGDVRVGQKAEITVDAIPGTVFTGKVESIAAGTGSVFALLPPENATGNFTKVVQRVPVKIVLDPGQSHTERLRAGLSVSVAISTRGG